MYSALKKGLELVHRHPKEGCDFIVCWENDLEEPDEEMPEIISLKEFIFR